MRQLIIFSGQVVARCTLQHVKMRQLIIFLGQVVVRSFAFTFLCIFWTYAVGIHEDLYTSVHAQQGDGKGFLKGDPLGQQSSQQQQQQKCLRNRKQASVRGSSREACTGDGVFAGGAHAQQHAFFPPSFTPCQLRFTPILFLDGWSLGVASACLLLATGDRMQRVGPSAAAAAHWLAASPDRRQRTQSQQQVRFQEEGEQLKMEYEVGSEDETQMGGGWIQHPLTSDADADGADYQEEGEDSQVGIAPKHALLQV